jgi:putative DNA methylase
LEANPWGTPKSSGSFSTLFESRIVRAKAYSARPFEVTVRQRGKGGGKVPLHGVRIAAEMVADFESLRRGAGNAMVLTGDSADLPVPAGSVDLVVTDPPYFDNVNYSELADLFYAWLAPAMASSDSSFAAPTTRHRQEVQSQGRLTQGHSWDEWSLTFL